MTYHYIPAGDFGDIILVRPAGGAEVGVTLAHRQEARALLRRALRLTPDQQVDFYHHYMLDVLAASAAVKNLRLVEK